MQPNLTQTVSSKAPTSSLVNWRVREELWTYKTLILLLLFSFTLNDDILLRTLLSLSEEMKLPDPDLLLNEDTRNRVDGTYFQDT
jgi:hypothetical protein